MTDKEKRELKKGVISIFKKFNILDHTATIGGLRNDILRYINSLQEEPVIVDAPPYDYVKGFSDGRLYEKRQKEEPVSEDLEEALAQEWKGYNDRGAAIVDALEDNTQELAFAKGFYRGSNWQKKQDQETIELAEDHAMLAGMNKMEKQMMKNAIDAHCFGFQGDALFSFKLPANSYLVGSKVKVIVIKED